MASLINIFTLSPSLVRRNAHSVNKVNNWEILREPIKKKHKKNIRLKNWSKGTRETDLTTSLL